MISFSWLIPLPSEKSRIEDRESRIASRAMARSSIRDPRSSILDLRFLAARIFEYSRPQSGGSLLVLFGVFLLESLDAARRLNQLLFAGEERVAVRADFHVNVFLRRTSRPRMTAGANDPAFDIFRMNSFFHSLFSFYLNLNKSCHCLQP